MELVEATHIFDYTAIAAKKGSRRVLDWTVRELFEAPIPSYSLQDVEHEIETKSHMAGRHDFKIVDGRVWQSAMVTTPTRGLIRREKESSTHHETLMKEMIVDPSKSLRAPYYSLREEYREFRAWDPSSRAMYAGDGSGLVNVQSSDREERLRLAKVAASELCYIDDILHSSRFEPVLAHFKSAHVHQPWVLTTVDIYDVKKDDRRYDIALSLRDWAAHPELARSGCPIETQAALFDDLGINWRMPTVPIQLRRVLLNSAQTAFRPNRGTTAVGGGSIAVPDLPEDFDEAVFDIRRSIRDLSPDFRAGLPSEETIDLAMARLQTFAEAFEREATLQPNLPKAVIERHLHDIRLLQDVRANVPVPSLEAMIEGPRP